MNDVRFQPEPAERSEQSRFNRIRGGLWQWVLITFDRIMDAAEEDWAIMMREKDLFLGALLFMLGLLDFHSGKYCDGNTADYLSCTRPVTYYYYTWLEIILIIVGVMFILLWFQKRHRD